jgi:osmotically-inducible protein OsmY
LKGSTKNIAVAAASSLTWNTSVPHESIKVLVQNGWITLSGEVDWWYQKIAATNAVRNLIGLNGLTNNITVKPKVDPIDMKVKIEGALQRNAVLNARQTKVETSGGKVVLSGIVRSLLEKEQAELAALAAPGVCEVVNNITNI